MNREPKGENMLTKIGIRGAFAAAVFLLLTSTAGAVTAPDSSQVALCRGYDLTGICDIATVPPGTDWVLRPSLSRWGANDLYHSVWVGSGLYLHACRHDNYRGGCEMKRPGTQSNFIIGDVSSVKLIRVALPDCLYDASPAAGFIKLYVDGQPPPPPSGIILPAQWSCQTLRHEPTFPITGDTCIISAPWRGVDNDALRSVVDLSSNGNWQLYRDDDCKGQGTFGSGSATNLGPLQVSSMRLYGH